MSVDDTDSPTAAGELNHYSDQLMDHQRDRPGRNCGDQSKEYEFGHRVAVNLSAEKFSADFTERAQLGNSLFGNRGSPSNGFGGRLKGVVR